MTHIDTDKTAELLAAELEDARAEIAELKRSVEKYRGLVDRAGWGIAVGSADGTTRELTNPAFAAMHGYTMEEATARPFTELFAPECRSGIAENLRLAHEKGHHVWEARHVRKDGSTFPVLADVTAVKDESGRVLRRIVNIQDITERKREDEVLAFLARTSGGTTDEPFFNALARYLADCLQMSFVCIDRLDGDGLTARTVAVWSDGKFEDNVSYALADTPCGDVVGKMVCCFPASVCQFFPRDQVLQDLRAESYVGVTLWGHTGKPIGLIAVIGRAPLENRSLAEATLKLVAGRAASELERLDAEEALRASEESLRRSEQRWNAAIENFGEGAIIATEAEQVIYWNPAARMLHGFTSDQEGIGPLKETPITFQLWTADGSRLLTLDEWPMRRIKRGETVRRLELRLRRPDQGWERIVSYSGAMVETATGERLIFLSVYDLTDQRKAEDALRQANEHLGERVAAAVADLRAKDQFLISQGRQAAMGEMIGNIAHQWRQPLNVLGLVLANIRQASRSGNFDAATVERSVAKASEVIGKMSSTITVFTNFFRPEKEKHSFSALTQIRETLALLEASFKNTGIAVEVEAQADVSLFGYSNEYAQVLLNLLSNAEQAIECSHVRPGRVTLRLQERDGLGCLTVRDNGGGIPEDILDKVFDPYFSTKEGGTGIGLHMSRQIAETSLGGRLEVRNVEGGAEFAVLTPLYKEAAGASAPSGLNTQGLGEMGAPNGASRPGAQGPSPPS